MAGWGQSELDWEHATEAFAAAVANGDVEAARRKAGQALVIAREAFGNDDPRLATAIANQSTCVARDDVAAGEKLLREARLTWNGTQPWISKMKAPRIARSSLFHLRMEQIHRDAYEDNWRLKWQELADQAKGRLAGVTPDAVWDSANAAAACKQWQRERPAMLNDTRKLIAAVRLLLPGIK